MASKRMVTLDDVAREAGVSVSTASRTLNGRPTKVGLDTQNRVRLVAQRLGYATNLAAQAVALGRSRSIGLVVSTIPTDYQNPVVAGVYRAASERDMLVTTAVSEIGDVERIRQSIRQLRGQRPSVVFVVGSPAPDAPGRQELIAELKHVEEEGGRVVLIGQDDTPFDSVTVDDHKAGADMARALAARGYFDTAVVAGSDSSQISTRRTAGFLDAMAELGSPVSPDRVVLREFDHDGGYRAAGELLRRRPVPTAIFCVNDAMAIGACVRFREQGFEVGTDIAVAGCDDIPALRDVFPPLSTVHLPWDEAAEAAFDLAAYDHSESRSVVLEGYPVMRASAPGVR
jgi:LacI family transcriptional regulator